MQHDVAERDQIIQDIQVDADTDTTTTEPQPPTQPPLRRSVRLQERIQSRSMHINAARQLKHNVRQVNRALKRKCKVTIIDMFCKVVAKTMAQIEAARKHDQVSVEECIKRYGQAAIQAVLSEYAQLDDKKCKPRYAHTLTHSERKGALNLITMVKQNRCGKIKGRACADNRKQRSYVPRKDETSPTLQLESLLLSLLIDAHENRHVGTADVAGAFLLANMIDFVLVKLKGESVSIMCKMNPSYKQYVTIENGKEVLYLQLVKALYGCIQSALSWYKTFTGKLSELGFTLNKYDPCVANKWINGSQCTICWYVDDTKMSHKDPKVIDWLVHELEQEFGKLTVKRGNKHTFVGIDFEIMPDGTVRLLVKNYLKECIESYEEIEGPITRSANTPAKHNLFNTNNREASKNRY